MRANKSPPARALRRVAWAGWLLAALVALTVLAPAGVAAGVQDANDKATERAAAPALAEDGPRPRPCRPACFELGFEDLFGDG